MSHVNELKQALENLSSKQHVISKEATLAKESLQENYNQKNNSELGGYAGALRSFLGHLSL